MLFVQKKKRCYFLSGKSNNTDRSKHSQRKRDGKTTKKPAPAWALLLLLPLQKVSDHCILPDLVVSFPGSDPLPASLHHPTRPNHFTSTLSPPVVQRHCWYPEDRVPPRVPRPRFPPPGLGQLRGRHRSPCPRFPPPGLGQLQGRHVPPRLRLPPPGSGQLRDRHVPPCLQHPPSGSG
jgi:hypothetical protein